MGNNFAKNLIGTLTGIPVANTMLRRIAHGFGERAPWFRRIPVNGWFSVKVPEPTKPTGAFRYWSTAGDPLGRLMCWRGYEVLGFGARVFLDLAKDAAGVLDIGANTGIYALVCARYRLPCVSMSLSR